MPFRKELNYELWLKEKREVVFEFFSNAGNLEKLTPNWLNFRILTPCPIEMKRGALIQYRIRYKIFPLRWTTRITEWNPPYRFVDEQLKGPYRQWMHEHDFVEQNGGTLVKDKITYSVWGGRLVNKLIVQKDVEQIFAYRRERMLMEFGG
ncbi:MAG: SRPBCC family protein [Verrucomicrobiales bacterium]